ncbi:hypothetical protein CUJ83_03230 [Methanocella sp. CWC-04]|uniref:PAS domain S-box-containing protein n=1 Tax=Methanooceanicella nereidis TaxID=2052831 RepID=A0AAP2RBR8_9EURY|nr:PAS domain S-box protein [Methanocella sp. CWC-04]MCD1294006.1 hypothetical protein [Methanocella sp. CWC-04]
MKRHYSLSEDRDELREKIIGLGENSFRKSYYPELQEKMADLERFRSLLDHSNDAIFLVNLSLRRIEDVNLFACNLLGYKREEMINSSFFDLLLHHDDRLVGKLVSGEIKELTITEMIKCRDMSAIPFEINIHVDTFGEGTYAVVIARDVRERLKAEETLKKNEEKYRLLVENAPIGIIFVDINGKILDANPMIIQLMGSPSREATLAINMFEFQPLIRSGVSDDIRTCLETGDRTVSEHEYISKWGKKSYLKYYITPVKGPDNRIIGAQGIVEDITEQRKADLALQESESKFRVLTETSSSGIFIYQHDRLCYVNPACENITGYGRDELLSIDIADLIRPDFYGTIDILKDKWVRERNLASNFEMGLLNKNGERRWISLTLGHTLYNGSKCIIGTIFDITERKLIEKALQDSEEKFRDIVENVNEFIWEIDKDLNVVYVSPKIKEYFGYSPEDIVGKTGAELLGSPDIDSVKEILRERISNKTFSMLSEYIFQDDKGKRRVLETSFLPIYGAEGEIRGYRGVDRDITDRKAMEEALIESRSNLQRLFDSLDDFIFVIDTDGNILQVNPPVAERLGYSIDELQNMTLYDLHPPEFREMAGTIFEEMLLDRTRICTLPIITKEGNWIEVETKVTRGRWNNKDAIFGISRDVTERIRYEQTIKGHAKKMEILNDVITSVNESEDLASILEETISSTMELLNFEAGAIYLLDDNGEFAYLRSMKGLPDNFVRKKKKIDISRKPYDMIFLKGLPMISQNYSRINPEMAKEWDIRSIAGVPLISKDKVIGALYIVSRSDHEFSREDVDLLTAIGREIGTAITKMQTEESLKSSLGEKEVLLKEIHHRVKNNLQIISSLLSLQSNYTYNEEFIQMIRDSKARVKSMALIHERLYESKDLSRIKFGEYVKALVTDLSRSFGISKDRIRITLNIDNVEVDVDTAIPCGLIINELVSNCIKYAFPGERRGDIYVSFRKESDTYRLTVKDNGVGLPDDLDINEMKSLGLQLVCTLTTQLDGTIEICSNEGAEFMISFREPV